MTLKYFLSRKAPSMLFFAIIVAVLSFNACSNSKKENKGNSQTTATTTTPPQQKTTQKTSEATTNKNAAADTEVSKSAAPETTPSNTAKDITAERGHKIIKDNGCLACHSTNGKKMAGPTLKNLYNRKTTLKNGKTISADSAYLIESIKDPGAKVVKGFSPVMPSFSYLKDDQIASIIAYIKSISE